MIIQSKGYDLKFIQREPSNDKSDHLFTLIYKFKSSKNKWNYILRAEYHKGDVFAVKFYAQQHSKSDYKYSKITNNNDVINILVTTAKIIPLLLADYPEASFGFTGARTLDEKSQKVENYEKNQRFRVYRNIITELIGNKTFTHYEYEQISGYLLINNYFLKNITKKEKELVDIFQTNYINLPDIG